MKLKYKLMLGIITIAIGICLMTYQSYALWVASTTGGENIVNVGCFEIEYTEMTSPISLYNSYPVNDQKGMSGTPYTFTIKNTCSIDSAYQITMNTFTTNQIPKEKLKYAFYKSTESKPTSGEFVSNGAINTDIANLGLTNLETSYLIGSGQLAENESATYHFYLWIDNSAGNEVMGQKFEASIKVVSAATKIPPLATKYITELAKTDTTNLAYDGTVDNNLRYIGANPNNYVQFNNELWRVIGVMNNVSDSNGNTSPKVKLIRNESIGKFSWDYQSNGNFINNWNTSTLQGLLNSGAYYNRTTGTYYNGSTTASNVDFTTLGLTEESKVKIANVIWGLGGMYNGSDLPNEWYGYERGTTVYSGHPTTWTGRIGLMYPSDYGFATSGGSSAARNTCLNQSLSNWNQADYASCKDNDWLYKTNFQQWTLSPRSDINNVVFYVAKTASIQSFLGAQSVAFDVLPTLYLDSDIKIVSGNGSLSTPFILS